MGKTAGDPLKVREDPVAALGLEARDCIGEETVILRNPSF
jgi:hypothetical protein